MPSPGDIYKLESRRKDYVPYSKVRNWVSYQTVTYIDTNDTLTYLGMSTCKVSHEPLYEFYASTNGKFYLTPTLFEEYATNINEEKSNPWWHLRKLT